MIEQRTLTEYIRQFCHHMEIPLIGFADVKRWNTPLFDPWIPQEFSPQSIFPGSQSVIVIGLPVHLPVLETSPSIWYRELYKTINSLLDQYTYRIASLLNERGHPSVSVPRDGYGSIKVLKKNPITFFSHRHAAALAGLGTFGTNNMVLTPDYGPRVRFASVFTQACLKADPIMTNNLCIRCNQCVSMCPVQAIEEGTYPQAITDKRACANYSADLNHHYISPCGICIKVCPVGADRSKFGREDPGIYDPGNEHDLKKGWNHVRQYGRM